jgi:hypothetical protein
MEQIHLKPGDLFGTWNPVALGRTINGIQYFWSSDGESTYSHSGIIETAQGDTYEALWTIRANHLRKDTGQQIIIARFEDLSIDLFRNAMAKLKARHYRQIYPFWRLSIHIFGPLAKRVSWKGKWVVCSELMAELEYLLGLRHSQYPGTNPDRLADEWPGGRDGGFWEREF